MGGGAGAFLLSKTKAHHMPKDLEYRVVDAQAAADGPGFDGYAATWWTVDTYGTAWRKGAFKKSIEQRGSRIPVLAHHDPNRPIGRLTHVEEDAKGLKFSASIVEGVRDGDEMMALLRADVPLGMSFGFRTIKERPPTEKEWEKLTFASDTDQFQTDEGRAYVRIKDETALWELSPVTFPANDLTSFTDVRAAVVADHLTTLIEEIRTGAVDERTAGLIDELVAAWGARTESELREQPPLLPDRARRDRDIAIAVLQAQYGPLLGETYAR
jgi:HK97 family phage prohead protease